MPVVTTLAWSNYAHTRIAILILSVSNTLANSWCQRNFVKIVKLREREGRPMERLYMEAQDGLKTIAPPLFLNIFFYFLLV